MYARDKKLINPHPRIKQLVDSQNLGKKTGKGFYEYYNDSYERISLTIEEAEKYSPVSLMAVAANNAAWLISNNVCTKTDFDKALNLGMGLKTDLFTNVKRFGVKNIINRLNEMSAKYGSRYEPNPYIETYGEA
jgi:enoyl-CoA hydratase/3-hydroxyacyl-CoA dehydrogenase